MRTLLLTALLTLLALPAAADELPAASEPPATASPPPTVSASPSVVEEPLHSGAGAAELVGAALDRLTTLEVLLRSGASELDRRAALRELEASRQALYRALVEVGRLREGADLRELLGRAAEPPPAAPLQDGPPVLAPEEFAALSAEIEGVAFTTGKMQVLQDRLATRRVTTPQARGLVEQFSFSRDRVDALVFLYPRVADPENFPGLLSALKFESDRAAVRSQLGLDG